MFICHLGIFIGVVSVQIFCLKKKNWFFSLLVLKSSLYILYTNPISDMFYLNIFFQSVAFYSLKIISFLIKVLLDISHISIKMASLSSFRCHLSIIFTDANNIKKGSKSVFVKLLPCCKFLSQSFMIKGLWSQLEEYISALEYICIKALDIIITYTIIYIIIYIYIWRERLEILLYVTYWYYIKCIFYSVCSSVVREPRTAYKALL